MYDDAPGVLRRTDVPQHFSADQIVKILAAFLDSSPSLEPNNKLIILEPSRVRMCAGL